MTPEGQRERAGSKQQRQGDAKPEDIRSTKKTGRGFHSLIPVSHHYSMGSGFKEVPTICSTRFSAASLVLKPRWQKQPFKFIIVEIQVEPSLPI